VWLLVNLSIESDEMAKQLFGALTVPALVSKEAGRKLIGVVRWQVAEDLPEFGFILTLFSFPYEAAV